MNNFNWEEFKNEKIGVQCNTREKAVDFINECARRNIFLPVKHKIENY